MNDFSATGHRAGEAEQVVFNRGDPVFDASNLEDCPGVRLDFRARCGHREPRPTESM